MEIRQTIKLTPQEAEDMLVGAVETGIWHWAIVTKYERGTDGYLFARLIDKHASVEGTEPDFESTMLTIADIQRGVDLLCASDYQWHVQDIVNDNADATTFDVVAQYAVLGEITYG